VPGKSKTAGERILHIDHLFARMQRLNTYEAKTNAMTRIGSNLSQVLPPPFIHSQHAHRISRPFQTGLSECKQIGTWLDATYVNIRPKSHDVILQLCSAAFALKLIAGFTEQCDLVAPLFTSNWQLHDEVLGRAPDFEGRLIRPSRILTSSDRALTEIQNSNFRLLPWTLSAYPEPRCYCED